MKATFTLILLLVCATAFGQRNFVPGYYLNHNGEKFSVYINDQNWEFNPRTIQVRKELDYGPVQTLHVTDIKGFGLNTGDVFESYIGDVEKGPTELKEVMLFDAKPVIERDTIFLRALVKGNVNLYYLQYRKGEEHYFVQKGEETPVELIYRTTRQVNGDRAGFTRLPIYKGMLRVKLTDCPEVSRKIDGVAFKKTPLKEIVENYNECVSGSKGEYSSSEEKIKVKLALVGGVGYTMLNMKDDRKKSLPQEGFNGIGYTFGASFQATLPRNYGRSAFMVELMYKPLRATGTYKAVNYASNEIYTIATSSFDMDYVGVNIMGRYRFTNEGLRPYINGGVGNNLMVANRSTQKRVVRIYDSETVYENTLSDIRKFEESFIFGLGAELKKLQGELRFEKGSGFSTSPNIKTRNHNFSLRLGYVL